MKKKLMSILLSAAVSVSMVAGMGAVVYADTAEDNEAIKLEKVKEADQLMKDNSYLVFPMQKPIRNKTFLPM